MLPGPVICLHSCKYIKAKSSPSPSPLSWLASFWIWFFLLLLFLVMFLSNLQLLLQISLSLCSISTELKKIITSPSTVYLVSGFVCLFFHWCSLSLYTQEINHALADIAVSSLFLSIFSACHVVTFCLRLCCPCVSPLFRSLKHDHESALNALLMFKIL